MPADADFYALELLLDTEDRALLHRVRAFMEKEVEPIINRYWTRAKFPHEILPGLARARHRRAAVRRATAAPGSSTLLDGMVAMELGPHRPVDRHLLRRPQRAGDGLDLPVRLRGAEASAGCRRWRGMEQIGAFGLTEPDVGSGVARGLATTARRDGDGWVLDGAQEVDRQRQLRRPRRDLGPRRRRRPGQGLRGRGGTPGFTTENLEDKIALRVVQNALITLDGVRVPEAEPPPGGQLLPRTPRRSCG